MTIPSRVAQSSLQSWRLAPSTTRARGIPALKVAEAALRSSLGAICGIGASRAVAERGLCHHPIKGLPLPLDALHLVVDLQSCLPQGFEEARFFPFLKAIMNCGTGSQFTREGVPLNTRSEHIHDGCKSLSVGHARAAPIRRARGLVESRVPLASTTRR